MASDGAFRLIQLHDDEDELVVHAGSGAPAQADAPREQAAAGAADLADAVTPTRSHGVEPQEVQAPDNAPAQQPADPERAARQEELRRRAEALEQAEAGLSNPKAHAGTHRAVIIGLVVLILVVAILSVLPHLGQQLG